MVTAIFIGILILIVFIQHRQITTMQYDIDELKIKNDSFQEIDDAVRPMIIRKKKKKKK